MKKIFLILVLFLAFGCSGFAVGQNFSAVDKNIAESQEFLVVSLQTYLAKGDYQNALKTADEALKWDAEWYAMYNNRALIHKNLGEFDLAMKDFDKAISLKSGYEGAILGRANLKMQTEDYKGALKDFNALLKNNPKNAHIYNSRGILYLFLKKPEKALSDFDNAIKLDEKKWIFYGNRGIAQMFIGDYQAAIEDYSKALDIYPYAADIYYRRALCLNHFPERKKECVKDFKKAAKLYLREGNKEEYNKIMNILNAK